MQPEHITLQDLGAAYQAHKKEGEERYIEQVRRVMRLLLEAARDRGETSIFLSIEPDHRGLPSYDHGELKRRLGKDITVGFASVHMDGTRCQHRGNCDNSVEGLSVHWFPRRENRDDANISM
jgi:hypothetical protein